MSEALYATILAYETTKEDIYLEWCSKIWNYIEAHFIDSENGGDWWGYLRRDGTVFNKLKGRDPPTWSAPTSKKLENIDRSVNPWSKVEIIKAAFTFLEHFFSRSYRLPASLSPKKSVQDRLISVHGALINATLLFNIINPISLSLFRISATCRD